MSSSLTGRTRGNIPGAPVPTKFPLGAGGPVADARLAVAALNRGNPLTERETEILDRIAAGRNNGQIASELYLSPKTIRNNVSSILTKLKVADRTEAALRAREAGVPRGPVTG